MCVTNASMSEGDEDQLKAQVSIDSIFFKALLDLVPPAAYFSAEEKNELLGNVSSDEEEEEDDEEYFARKKKKYKKMKGLNNPLSAMSVSEITDLRIRGESLVTSVAAPKKAKKGASHEESVNGQGTSLADEVDAKHAGKKKSRNAKAFKNKGRELQKREARLEELQKRLRVKLEEIKARKTAGKSVTSQEQKRLRRQEKKVSSKLKGGNTANVAKGLKNKVVKERRMGIAEGLRSPPHNQILNMNGDVVKSKYDFSVFSMGNDTKKSSDLHGKDYKRLLEKVEKRQEMVQELKEKDPEKGKKLEQKLAWQSTMSRAKGEKVKDDPVLLKKSLKRKEKMKDQRKKKWDERVQHTDDMKDKRQQKRQTNLDKRKKDKNDKKKKKLVKKGRVIPGF